MGVMSAALALDNPREAVAVGAQIDTRLLPAPLVGRRARLHVDLADGHARLGEDAIAAVHILDVARRAPQLLRVGRQLGLCWRHYSAGPAVPPSRSFVTSRSRPESRRDR